MIRTKKLITTVGKLSGDKELWLNYILANQRHGRKKMFYSKSSTLLGSFDWGNTTRSITYWRIHSHSLEVNFHWLRNQAVSQIFML